MHASQGVRLVIELLADLLGWEDLLPLCRIHQETPDQCHSIFQAFGTSAMQLRHPTIEDMCWLSSVARPAQSPIVTHITSLQTSLRSNTFWPCGVLCIAVRADDNRAAQRLMQRKRSCRWWCCTRVFLHLHDLCHVTLPSAPEETPIPAGYT